MANFGMHTDDLWRGNQHGGTPKSSSRHGSPIALGDLEITHSPFSWLSLEQKRSKPFDMLLRPKEEQPGDGDANTDDDRIVQTGRLRLCTGWQLVGGFKDVSIVNSL